MYFVNPYVGNAADSSREGQYAFVNLSIKTKWGISLSILIIWEN